MPDGMCLTSLSLGRGAPGDLFTIYGRNLGARGSKIPSINRRRAYPLEVLSWWRPFWSSTTRVRVRIPSGLPSGRYKVLIYYDSSYRTGSNSLDFWVTAVPVPLSITDPYEVQVRSFKICYGKSDEWERWMLDNRSRYETAFRTAIEAPSTLRISFRYETHPIAYNPPWSSEDEHMRALEAMAELCYAGYDFRFIFGGDTASSYINVIAGISSITSHASGKDVYLYYETIFIHEFAHLMNILHHYEGEEYGTGLHMPPGEVRCLMDRTTNQFCSACRTALNIPLNVDNEEAIERAVNEILRRYPY
ncbi:MAG: hypothetical protein QXP45_04455 [Thermoproteota archaeon]